MARETTHEILEHLNTEQLQAVTAKEHPLIIIAGAGSGKTRVLTRRIAFRIVTGDAEARHTLAVTFTKKAATELKQRLNSLKMREQIEAHTFHSAALRTLQRYWQSREASPFELLESKYRLVAEAIASMGSTTRSRNTDSEVAKKSLIAAVTAEIEWAKARGLNPTTYPEVAVGQNRRLPLASSEIGEAFLRYEKLKSRQRKLDYDDLIMGATHALQTDPAFADAEHYRMRHLYIDEFQDINPSQMLFVDALLGERTDLCVVGDPNQAIYSWNGADPSLITSLSKKYSGARTVILSQNYRSTPQVLTLAKSVLGRKSRESPVESSLVPNIPDGPIPAIRAFSTDLAEAQSLARLVKQARQPGTSWDSIAILARTNSQLLPIQKAFRTAGIPAFIAGEASYINQSEIRALLASLERGAVQLRGTSLLAWLEGMVESSLQNYQESASSADNLNLFLELARDFLSNNPDADSRSLSTWMRAESSSALEETTRDAVALTTFHKAKGLEWRAVFVAGMEEGLVPIAKAESAEALSEEKRLLYVAITRAKKEITLTWAKQRAFGERRLTREPSRYLCELQEAIDELSGHVATPEHALSAIRRARLELKASEPAEKQLTDRQLSVLSTLRIWRSNKAKDLGVPAHVILHDFALETMVQRSPCSIDELAAIAGVGRSKATKFGRELLRFVSPEIA